MGLRILLCLKIYCGNKTFTTTTKCHSKSQKKLEFFFFTPCSVSVTTGRNRPMVCATCIPKCFWVDTWSSDRTDTKQTNKHTHTQKIFCTCNKSPSLFCFHYAKPNKSPSPSLRLCPHSFQLNHSSWPLHFVSTKLTKTSPLWVCVCECGCVYAS